MKTLLPFLALYKRYWFRISLGMCLSIITLLASIGLLTLSGWFLSATSIAGLLAITTFNYMLPAAGVRGAAIIRTAGRYAERLVSHDTTFRILSLLRIFSFTKLFPLSPAVINRYRQADLLNRFVADIDTLDHLYLRLLSPFLSAIVVIVILTFALSFINHELAMMLAAIMLVTLFTLPWLFYTLGKSLGRKLTQLRSQYRIQLTTWLSGHAELTIFNAADRFRAQLDKTEQSLIDTQKRNATLTGLSQALITLISGLTFIAILWLVGDSVSDGLSSAFIALFVFAAISAFECLAPIGNAFQHLSQVLMSAERVKELLEQQPAVQFPDHDSVIMQDRQASAALRIENLYFAYPDQPQSVLHGISLAVQPGQHVALLGKTGCGKSTLLQLITRAWQPQQGAILLNDIAIEHYSQTNLRCMVSVVSQRAYIFSATLRYNLLIGNEHATDQQLIKVLFDVGLSTLLEEHGLDNWIGEGGRILSGGESRRLSIARALLHAAPIILLDEPTEGLDAITEQQILTLLHEQFSEKTLLTITHRLVGLEKMDTIYVMDGGKIIEQGNHQHLLQQQGLYYGFHHPFGNA